MFLHLLSPAEQSAFLSLARQLIVADGQLAKEEVLAIKRMADEMDISADSTTSLSEVESIATFQSQRAKDAALLELLGLAYADDSFVAAEHEFIKRVAEGFSVSTTRLQEMTAWVEDVKSLTIKAATSLISA